MRAGWSAADVPDLSGRVAVVTGANRGLGREVTRLLAGRGARVIMACRDEAGGEAAAAALRAAGGTGALEVRPLDLASLASVEKFAAGLAGEPRLDLLGNNAGLMAVDRGLTADGLETHIGVNHLGHFAPAARGGDYYGPVFQAWGPPVRERPSRQARDPGLAAQLWEESERLTGVTFTS